MIALWKLKSAMYLTTSMWIVMINFQPLKTKEVIFITLSPAWEFNVKHWFQSLNAGLPLIIEQMSGLSGLDQMELH